MIHTTNHGSADALRTCCGQKSLLSSLLPSENRELGLFVFTEILQNLVPRGLGIYANSTALDIFNGHLFSLALVRKSFPPSLRPYVENLLPRVLRQVSDVKILARIVISGTSLDSGLGWWYACIVMDRKRRYAGIGL